MAVVITLAFVLGAAAFAFSNQSQNKTDIAQIGQIGPFPPGVRACGGGLINASTSAISVAHSSGPESGVTCLDVLVTNTKSTPIQPGVENLTVYDGSGRVVFTTFFAFMGANSSFLLPGQTWESYVFWNSGQTATPGAYQVVATLPYQNVTTPSYAIATTILIETASEPLVISS